MRKVRTLLVILLLALGGAVIAYGLQTGWFTFDRARIANIPANIEGPNTDGTNSKKIRTEARPTFDIVRAERDGSIVMAGQSKPGWTVIVESNGAEVGRATADENGEWIIQPNQKLVAGEHSLELSAIAPKGGSALFSKQRLALSLSDPIDGQPLVALTEEGKATRVLQMPPARENPRLAAAGNTASPATTAQSSVAAVSDTKLDTATATAPATEPNVTAPTIEPKEAAVGANRIGFASADYEEAGEKSMFYLSGHAVPDSRVVLYVDNELAGIATADATGSWSFSGNKQLGSGRHVLRADLLAAQSNDVIARAEVDFDRAPPAQATVAASASGSDGFYEKPLPGAGAGDQGGIVAPADSAAGQPSGPSDPQVIIVKRGDTLWHIAQQHFGDGRKFTQIFKNNQGQIRDPNWVYPNQQFTLPER